MSKQRAKGELICKWEKEKRNYEDRKAGKIGKTGFGGYCISKAKLAESDSVVYGER